METPGDSEIGKHLQRPTIELPSGWGKDLSGRRVDFGSAGEDKGLVWGIELTFPLEDDIRKHLGGIGIVVPDRVKTVKFLDMAPQESLPKRQRTIRSNWDEGGVHNTTLQKLADTTNMSNFLNPVRMITHSRAKDAVRDLFRSVFTNDATAKQSFNELIENSKGDTLLLVEGHGGGDPPLIGEQYPDEVVGEGGEIIQKKGNWIPVDSVLEKYNDPSVYAGIVLKSCYIGENGMKAKDVPFAHAKGVSTIPSSIWFYVIRPKAVVLDANQTG